MAAYAWLTNTADAGDEGVWSAMLVSMASLFVGALAVPEIFGAHGVVFGVAFLIVNVMYVVLYAQTARGDRDLLRALLRIAPWALAGSVVILAAGFVDGDLRSLLWLLALVVGYLAPGFMGTGGFRVEPAHFVERHGLIVIIAIGESLVAIGLGARGTPLGAGEIAAAVLGFLVATSFWLAYFDYFQIAGRQLLADRSGTERTALARDVYSYLHLPMVAGIILFAFAMKETLAHVADELGTIAAMCLCGGPALYLFAYVALRYRVSRTLGRGRVLAAVALVLLIPVALTAPALVALALVAAVCVGLHTYEIIWWREDRARIRAHRLPA